MALKYKIGDRVRIKGIDWYNENKDAFGNIRYKRDGSAYPVFFSKYMSNFCGEILTIKSVFKHSYHMNETSSCEFWTDEMIEGLVEEETKPLTYEETVEIIETMQGIGDSWECPQGYQFVDENGNIINATKIVLEKKKKEYPKTYEECCKVLGYGDIETYCIFHTGADERLFEALYRLKVCRDAYWKIAEEEMGLDGPWEPDWNDEEQDKYGFHSEVKYTIINSATFVFPTAEMRDAFYENFDPDIEICKEFL